MSEALQLGPPAASSYCHQQDYYSKQSSSSYNANQPVVAQEPSESHSPLRCEAPPSASLEVVCSSSRPQHADQHRHQRAHISPWSAQPHRQVQHLIIKQQQQASAIKHFETGSDNRLNSTSFHNRTNFHQSPAHRQSSSPSDASLMMRTPALYRPDAGDNGGALPTSLPAPPCPQAGVGGGGQRAAFKLAGAAAQQQQQHQSRKMPICQRSTWPAGPHSPGQADYGDCDEQQSDECSCSSSIDCLSSPTGHLGEPKHLHQPAPQRNQPHHVRHPQQHLAERPSDDDCSFIQQRPHQHHQHHHHHQHHQAFHDHRPLVPHSSVPPYTGSSASPHAHAHLQQQQQQPPLVQQHQQAAQPPPLLRQTTYTATSETITDSAPAGGGLPIPLTPPPPPVMGSAAAASANTAPSNADMVIRANAYHTLSRLEQKQGAHYSKQRQTVSFRRSATADYAADMKQQQPGGDYSDNNGQNDDKSHKALLHRQRSAGIGLTSAGSRALGGAQAKQSSTVSSNRTTTSNNNSNAKINGQPGSQLRPASLHNHSSTSPLSIVANTDANQHHQHHQHLNTTAPMTPAAGYPPSSPLPSQAIRAGLLAPLTTTFDGVCSLPAITSHRTNSPWMRISSIILAPIGLIIILFIVVSPLLHYLM